VNTGPCAGKERLEARADDASRWILIGYRAGNQEDAIGAGSVLGRRRNGTTTEGEGNRRLDIRWAPHPGKPWG